MKCICSSELSLFIDLQTPDISIHVTGQNFKASRVRLTFHNISERILTEIFIEVKEMALKVPLKGHHYDIRLYPNPQSSIWQT